MSGKGKEVVTPSAYKIRSLCIIAGTDLGKDRSFVTAATDLGKEMATRKISVVYGGGTQGLGAAVAMAAVIRDCKVTGIPLGNVASNSSNPIFSFGRELKMWNTHERMDFMIRSSDALIIMPGGIDNLELFSTLMLWAVSNVHKRPLGFLNVIGFYDGLLAFLANAGEQGFITQEISHLIVSAPNADQLIDRLQELIQAPHPSIDQVVQYTGDKRKREEPDLDLKL